MAQDLKRIVRRLFEEAWGAGRLETLEFLCDESVVTHDAFSGNSDLDGLEDMIRTFRTAFPDLTPTVLGMIAEGETVCTRWRMDGTHQNPILGVPASGRRVSVDGITVSKFRGGKVYESFVQWNALSLLQQLGVVPGRETLMRPRTGEAEAQEGA